MITTLIVLIVITAILLVLVVLGQNSKGGGFSSNFSASNQLIGVKKTGDLLEKLTWGFAITLMVLCLAVNIIIDAPTAETQMGTPATRTTGQQQQLPTMAPQEGDTAAVPGQQTPAEQAPADQAPVNEQEAPANPLTE